MNITTLNTNDWTAYKLDRINKDIALYSSLYRDQIKSISMYKTWPDSQDLINKGEAHLLFIKSQLKQLFLIQGSYRGFYLSI